MSQVVIACLTPRYVTSHHCSKEIALADLLHKPIIPVVYEMIPWPPGGAMSLVFAQLVYINLKGEYKVVYFAFTDVSVVSYKQTSRTDAIDVHIMNEFLNFSAGY
jgi:hypothetical protein